MTAEILQQHFPLWKREIVFPLTSKAPHRFPVLFTSPSLSAQLCWGFPLLSQSALFSTSNALSTMMNAMQEQSGAQTSCSETRRVQPSFLPGCDAAADCSTDFPASFFSGEWGIRGEITHVSGAVPVVHQ